ncbi:MAG: dUTP diphosphatase [Saprospiraceae bacterium]|jgi:dUTP pyrophosphatase|nr:dUTP diphosphatase [Saprospiraceae bacterium]MCA0332888.1 dUTP diphosphatase [Bacteroidota bacterium]MCB0603684.1 dUTP diphosphatase [Saprospiraceae bacterium]MCO5277100.1 dUTP diphosphatase [Saprospiraceae bacterium]HMT78050.1 dUTP diphosphatase [Saprospiraceae bacterium]
MQVKIINKSRNPLPRYETSGSAGMDLRANIDISIELQPLERILIPTGLFFELLPGTEAQIRPRSGLSIKKGLTVINAPGTIDSDYRGEIKVPMINLSNELQTIDPSERIAQVVFARHETVSLLEVDDISPTERGAGGFGSTGGK